MTTTLMECTPGASIQALDGTRYIDDGLGRVEIAGDHLREALAAGWKVVDGRDPQELAAAQIAAGLEGIDASDQRLPAEGDTAATPTTVTPAVGDQSRTPDEAEASTESGPEPPQRGTRQRR